MKRREFIRDAGLAAFGTFALTHNAFADKDPFEGHRMSVAELQSMMTARTMSSVQLVDFFSQRISTVDKPINSIIELNPDARSIAAQMDRERKAGKVRGPLHGIPVVLKDNIDTADRMKTTAGSLALADAPTPKKDAFIVSRLREAGAVILAKTNLSEWANFRDNDSISGWSGRGGQTRNPYILDRNPCGSSSGTGAAIAAGLATIGIGTETDGSIVCPASICGIVGLKPTVGLASRSGIIPISETQDTAGPMCRTVADVAAVLNVIDSADSDDSVTTLKRERVDYTNFLKKNGLVDMRIGVARDYWGRRSDVDLVLNSALETLKKAGAVLVDVKFPNLRKFGDAEFLVLKYEFKDGLEKYLKGRNSQHKTLEDLIRFNRYNAEKELPYFGQSILEESAKLGDLNTKEYKDALETCRRYSRDEGIYQVMNENKLDAIIGPSNAPTWMIDTVNGDCGSGYVGSSSLAAVAGYPNITVPAGMIRELPIGVSFFGRAWSEGTLIKAAYAFEQMTNARREPKFLPTYR
ncbi:MAG TPA: amidase [Pyrinomonadaceae bacterium]|nr:amidase [Pyrinomonadaceae bacterium]